MADPQKVLIAGEWRPANATGAFHASEPLTGEAIDESYSVSSRKDVDAALRAGKSAAEELSRLDEGRLAEFLDAFADLIEKRADEIVAMAHRETALPASPRLADVELPRTTSQLRQAAAARRDGSWAQPTIDTTSGIRSIFGPLSAPVAVFGPNNFPLAFNSVSGGDFAAAIAAGNPVIAKANTSHPGTTRLLAEAAFEALKECSLPLATVQLLYRTSHDDGSYMVSHPLIGATGYTGSRTAGLTLKEAADAAGKPIYLELSSVNPVFYLPGALTERREALAGEFATSALMGAGQFCTNPGVNVILRNGESDEFLAEIRKRFDDAEPGTLLSSSVLSSLGEAVQALQTDGAELVTGGTPAEGAAFRFQNTLMTATGKQFLKNPEGLQREAFGNAILFIIADDENELSEIAGSFEGNLTGCLYSHTGDDDDGLYDRVAERLRPLVGRLLNDKMPTGVAVCPSMNHGGPFPATGHPGFTAVGIPASLPRFALLQCYDNVREHRLPPALRNANPSGQTWRSIDGEWTKGDVTG